ncbi:MAG: ABC transporter ATP-binding protein [Rhodobacteraceae bacterium]|nr:ABC transporter ATP-binding protein [Paracoccaceae bacterium]
MPADPRIAPDIVCKGLAKRFGDVVAVDPLDVTFRGGQTTALVGPSGCGKSTLLRLVAGLERPDAGSIRIGDDTPDAVRAQAGLAIAFQDPSLLPWRTARGNVALAQRLAGQRVDAAAIDAMLDLVGLDGFFDARPGALSGGMRQRAAIARCLITQPRLLLLDEPFGAVDELTRRKLSEDLPPIWQARGTTTLLVTHSVTEAVLLSQRVLVFSPRPARIVADIAIDLPDPRPGQETTPAFIDLAEQVSAALIGGEGPSPRRLAAQ